MTSRFSGLISLVIANLICQGTNVVVSASTHIEGPEERTVLAGSNFSLSCHGDEMLAWKHPESDGSKFSETTEKSSSGYTSMLTVESPDYLATGFYTCLGQESDSSVYVFIFDKDHLLAVNHNGGLLLMGYQYENVIIPCKPTSPEVNVTLLHHDKPVLDSSFDASYHRYFGFTLSNLKASESYTFQCVGQIGDSLSTDSAFYYLQVLDAVIRITVRSGGGFQRELVRYVSLPDEKSTTEYALFDIRQAAATHVYRERYDPKIGFIIPNATISDSDNLICTAVNGDDMESADFLLTIEPRSEIAPKPEIEEGTIQHVVLGQDVTIECYVTVEHGLTFKMDWIIPESANVTGHHIARTHLLSDGKTWVTTMTLFHVTKEDEGDYTCVIEDHSRNFNSDTKYLRIYSEDDSFINITVQSKRIEVDARINRSAKWIITINAHPNVEVTWFDPHQKDLTKLATQSDKYQVRGGSMNQRILEIFDVDLSDAGNYTLIASNSGGKKSIALELIVLDKPVVSTMRSRLYRINVPTNVSCYVNGYPPPEVHWEFRRCNFPHWDNCSEFHIISAKEENIYELQLDDSHIVSTLEWNMREPGELSCSAENNRGKDTAVIPVRVTEVPEGFVIRKVPEEVVEGDDLNLNCAVASYNYSSYPIWFFESEPTDPIEAVDKNIIVYENKNYSYISEIRMKNVNVSNSGLYICQVYGRAAFGIGKEESVRINVLRVKPPEIYETNLPNSEITISSWQPLTWNCSVRGVPEPVVSWYKDGKKLEIDDRFSNYELLHNNQTLSIKSLTSEEEGKYVCRVKNKGGSVEAYVSVKLKDNHKTNTTLIITVVVVAVFLVIVLFLFFYCLRKMAKEKEELKLAGLQNFKEGMTHAINQELTLDQQTDLLPYDPKWEFPSSKLKLGKQLGAGAFGVVLKAEAYGIVEKDEWTTVAVKMVKRHVDAAHIRALVSELKILTHLGKHLNVVNLLGACTKNYMKRELLVIVEFCKFGNAHNYLLSHRHSFIDQIDPATGEIDFSKSKTPDNYNRIRINYATLTFPRSVDSDPNSALTSFNTEVTCLSSIRSVEENSMNSNNNPDWCQVLQGDYKRYNVNELSTSTLICWSFQVARGMEYLASRRVLHGDLAARNVLIADNNVVKICDFGFAKNIYSHPEYQKTGDGPVPVKWMAIESITRRIFSTQSDVWSFGIVLWEFFSLAKTPYPGFEDYESILKKLEDGYRMEKPQYANQKLYDIMLECWDEQPCRRPSFSELVMKLGKLLESNVREHYIELNEPYQKEAVPDGEDYLSMMSPPTYDPPVSHYVNEPFSKQASNEDGYLDMRSSWNPVKPNSGDPEDNIEMKPMLTEKEQRENDFNDDYLIPRQVPANTDCAFNPGYIMSTKLPSKIQPNYGKINRS